MIHRRVPALAPASSRPLDHFVHTPISFVKVVLQDSHPVDEDILAVAAAVHKSPLINDLR